MAKRSVDIIRHAKSVDNERSDYIGGRNLLARLSNTGIAEAKLLGTNYPIAPGQRLLSSLAVRAVATAQFAYPDHSIELDKRFVELSQGSDEGKLRKEVHTPSYIEAMRAGGWTYKNQPDAESWKDAAGRMLEGINAYAEGGDHLTVISHVSITRATIGLIQGLTQDEAYGQKIGNTQVSRLIDQGRGWRVEFVGLDAAEVAANYS